MSMERTLCTSFQAFGLLNREIAFLKHYRAVAHIFTDMKDS